MREAFPPEPHPDATAAMPVTGHEAVGDLHLAGDDFAGAMQAYRQALALQTDPACRGRLLLRIAEAGSRRGDVDAAWAAVREARRETRALDDPRLRARIAARAAAVFYERGHYRRSARYARFAFAALRGTEDHVTVARASELLGMNELRVGRPRPAIEWLQSAAATYRRIDDANGLVSALNNLGLIHKNLREWDEATRHLERALEIDEQKGFYARTQSHHQNLGLIRLRLGQWAVAEDHFGVSLRIAREIGYARGEANARLALGMLARRRRDLEGAGEHYAAALAIAHDSGYTRDVQLANEFLAELDIDRGRGQEALARLEPALADARLRAPGGEMETELVIRTGMARLLIGDLERAQHDLAAGCALAARLGDPIERGIALRAQSQLAARRHDAAAIETLLREAAALFESVGERHELALTLAAWASHALLLPAGQRLRLPLAPITEAVRRAAELFRGLGVPSQGAEALLEIVRLEIEREQFDQAVLRLEEAEALLDGESGETGRSAQDLRREVERQYVALSLSTCNEFRALEDANRLFRDTADMDDLLAQVVKLAVEHAGGDRGFVAFTAHAGRFDVVAQHGLGRDRARRILAALDAGTAGRLADGGPLFSSRVAADTRFTTALRDALDGVGSLVGVPLHFPSQAVGLVYVDRLNDNLLGAFRQRELNLLAVLANTAGVAMVEAQRSRLLAENRELRDRLRSGGPEATRVISQSREIAAILQMLRKVADTPANILFVGETGTGKGLFAQVLHEISARREGPFVQVNCAALPEALLESELFGHVQGAFTGASRDKAGLFEEATGGTLFLDEIEKIPASIQAKLLHVLDRGEIRPVGATRGRQMDVRVICATGCDLRERIRDGRFLEDLYYRLNDITVKVPALRERRDDITLLAEHFRETYATQLGRRIPGFTAEVMRFFLEHDWRGNVRELEKAVKRMVVLADDDEQLGVHLLPSDMRDSAAAQSGAPAGPRRLRNRIAELEKRMIGESLQRHEGNKLRVSRDLGISYPTLLQKIRLYALEPRRRHQIRIPRT